MKITVPGEDLPYSFPQKNAPLRRYLTRRKLELLISTSALWLSRLDLLEDPFEGASSAANIQERELSKGAESKYTSKAFELSRQWVYVSCWHGAGHESTAMWDHYSLAEEGVTICSSIQRVMKCLEDCGSPYQDSDTARRLTLDRCFVGYVRYSDFEADAMPEEGGPWRFLNKRKPYEHEKEFRVIAMHPAIVREGGVSSKDIPSCQGINVPVDLNVLIEEFVLAPRAGTELKRVVESLVQEHRLKASVVESVLGKRPAY